MKRNSIDNVAIESILKKKEFIMTHSRMSPPEWIKNLPAGEYDSVSLMKITGLASHSLLKMLKKHGAEIKKVHSGYRNLYKNIYFWNGYKKD